MGPYAKVGDAVKRVLADVDPIHEKQKVAVKSSTGRVLAHDVVARHNLPRYPISHMDGFAVVSSDLAGATASRPARLRIQAGHRTRSIHWSISPGETARVHTGAPLPRGADAVVPVEEVREDKGDVLLSSEIRPGSFVYQTAADFKDGELLLGRGWTIRSQDVGLLLTLGLVGIEVFRRPKVAVLATGSELSNRSHPPEGKVRNTHGPIFLSMLRALGCLPVEMGICKDDAEVLTRRVSDSLSRADMVLTLGGTSAGRLDLIGPVVEKLKPSVMFHGMRMDRGRVAGVAVLNHRPLVMLPGPIQGAMNAFNLLGVPIIERLRGGGQSVVKIGARLGARWHARPHYEAFAKVVYVRLTGPRLLTAEPLVGDTESITILTRAMGYVVVPEGVTRLEEDEQVEVNLLPGFSFAS